MKPTLQPGLKYTFAYTVPVSKTVPHLYQESPELAAMPEVFATGFMVGLLEWTCLQLLAPHLDEGEGSVGVQVNVSHQAATPPGFTVTVEAECIEVNGPRATFAVRAHDGVDTISQGRHERFIVKWDRFNARLAEKMARAQAAAPPAHVPGRGPQVSQPPLPGTSHLSDQTGRGRISASML